MLESIGRAPAEFQIARQRRMCQWSYETIY